MVNRLVTSLFLVLLLASIGLKSSRQLYAQGAPTSELEALKTDSTAWQRVVTYAVSKLSPNLVRGAMDSTRQPWELKLPPDEPQRYLIESQLRTILRARPPTASDSVVYALELGPLRIEGDTARVHMRTRVTRRCPGTALMTGSGSTQDVLVPRTPYGFWGAARVSSVVVGDQPGCPRVPR